MTLAPFCVYMRGNTRESEDMTPLELISRQTNLTRAYDRMSAKRYFILTTCADAVDVHFAKPVARIVRPAANV